MMFNIKFLMCAGLLVASQSIFANQWLPSSGSSVKFEASSLKNAEIGIFNVDSRGLTAEPLATFTGNAIVTFVQQGHNWNVSVGGKTATLANANQFQLAWLSNGVWVTELNVVPSATTPNLWELTFLDSAHGSVTESVTVSNIEPVQQVVSAASSSYSISEVPLSATVWVFLSGLLGCLAVGKHRIENK
ncbi:hypothetical protein [Methylomonas sp. AM2-LC]|uniref:hypothetical protein n=1 Tax=Methylomonas sp. AM2-LC TaxID=3153301 RepID=UPI003265F0DA